MFKELIFSSKNSFSAEPIIVPLDKHINVIIGPKGGGKSTLFDLIAGLKDNYISDNVIKALDEYKIKFEKAIKFTNEVINASQLSRIKNKEKEEKYKNRNDVIYQDDPIKKDLTSSTEIEKNKFAYLKKQIENSKSVESFINQLKTVYLAMEQIYNLFQLESVNINWSNTFKMKELSEENDLKLITKLDYKSFNIHNKIKQEKIEIENLNQSIRAYNLQLDKSSKFNFNEILHDEHFNDSLNKIISIIVNKNEELTHLFLKRTKQLDSIEKCTKAFQISYKKVLDNIKNENFSSNGLKSYETQAINHFKEIAKSTFKIKKEFENLLNSNIEISIENDMNQNSSLIYSIVQNVHLTSDDVIQMLEAIFYVPSSSRIDVSKWLNEMMKKDKGVKDFNENKIRNKITEIFKPKTKVLVDGNKDYDTLSLGQRSIYGLKYKFNKSIDEDLFLDQPEDNLDNSTIANEVLSLINKKQDNQVFIVTHNANIGILSNPNRVIIADLANSQMPYESLDVAKLINEESANYLEGGKNFLEQRFRKIIEGEK